MKGACVEGILDSDVFMPDVFETVHTRDSTTTRFVFLLPHVSYDSSQLEWGLDGVGHLCYAGDLSLHTSTQHIYLFPIKAVLLLGIAHSYLILGYRR